MIFVWKLYSAYLQCSVWYPGTHNGIVTVGKPCNVHLYLVVTKKYLFLAKFRHRIQHCSSLPHFPRLICLLSLYIYNFVALSLRLCFILVVRTFLCEISHLWKRVYLLFVIKGFERSVGKVRLRIASFGSSHILEAVFPDGWWWFLSRILITEGNI